MRLAAPGAGAGCNVARRGCRICRANRHLQHSVFEHHVGPGQAEHHAADGHLRVHEPQPHARRSRGGHRHRQRGLQSRAVQRALLQPQPDLPGAEKARRHAVPDAQLHGSSVRRLRELLRCAGSVRFVHGQPLDVIHSLRNKDAARAAGRGSGDAEPCVLLLLHRHAAALLCRRALHRPGSPSRRLPEGR